MLTLQEIFDIAIEYKFYVTLEEGQSLDLKSKSLYEKYLQGIGGAQEAYYTHREGVKNKYSIYMCNAIKGMWRLGIIDDDELNYGLDEIKEYIFGSETLADFLMKRLGVTYHEAEKMTMNIYKDWESRPRFIERKAIRTLQEIFDIAIETKYYVSREMLAQKKHGESELKYRIFMCTALKNMELMNIISNDECRYALSEIYDYLGGYLTMAKFLRENFKHANPMNVYRDWKNRPMFPQ